MPRLPAKIGYCTCCMQNIPHVRRVTNRYAWCLDTLTLRLARLLRIGPWYCVQCNTRHIMLHARRRSAPTFDPNTDKTSDNETESVGNYIRTTESLVMRRNRAKRYSQKYRDGVVNRLIGGTATISQIGQELDLSERDLVDWIADALARKQERIEELTALLDALGGQMDHSRIEYQPVSYASEDDEKTIEGAYREQDTMPGD